MTREIDARVAREVMGWKEDKTDGFGYPKGDFYPPNNICGVERIIGFDTDHVKTRKFEPSTDMNAAMEVVTRVLSLRDTEFSLSYDEKRRPGDDGKKKEAWCAQFKFDVKRSLMPKYCIAWADTPQLAICLAALEAVKP